MHEQAVRIEHLTKRYGRYVALEDVSFDVSQGELFALLGPNGAGKTTLIHVLCTIHGADSGTASVFGQDVSAQPRKVRRDLGVVFQEPSLDGRLTVHENLDFHGRIFGVPRRIRKRRIDDLLHLVELEEWRDRLVRELSSGMKRRLEIARALVHEAQLLILDEPTVGLDAQTRERMWMYLHSLRRERSLTVFVTSHYIDEVEQCDRVCIIDHGGVLALGEPERLKREHGAVVVRCEPVDDGTERRIHAAFGDRVSRGAGGLIVEVGEDRDADAFIDEFGPQLHSYAVERPSLESVFLSLTGRELRDQAAGARQRLYAFGQRGGEHTR